MQWLHTPMYEQEVTVSQAMLIALRYHKAGELSKAIKIYRQILKVNPKLAEVHGNLGSALKQQGQLEEAADCYRTALVIKPEFAEMHFNLGNVLLAQQKLEGAIACYQQALLFKPDFAPLHNNLGNALELQQRFVEAELCYRYAIKLRPTIADHHYNLANVLKRQDQLNEAAVHYRHAINLNPQFLEAHIHLGNILKNQFQFELAALCYRRAIQLTPDQAELYHLLGTVLQSQQLWEEATIYYRHAINLKPDLAEAHNNLGNLLMFQNRLEEAIICYHYALTLQPEFTDPYYNLGNLLKSRREFEEAERCYRQALAIQPQFAEGYNILGEVLRLQGKFAEAKTAFQQALTLVPHHLIYRLNYAWLLPTIPSSQQQLQEAQQEVTTQLTELFQHSFQLTAPWQNGLTNQLYLAHYGLADQSLQSQLAEFFQRIEPSLLYTAPHCLRSGTRKIKSKIKVGIVVRDLSSHGLIQFLRLLSTRLPENRFSLHLFLLFPCLQQVKEFLAIPLDQIEILAMDLSLARPQLAKRQLDILFYPDSRAESFTYFLGFARLAPVQCVGWGYSLLTPLPMIDYLLTAQNLVSIDSFPYPNKLRLFEHLPFFYEPFTLPNPLKTRKELGLPENAHLYLCPQSLFKCQPRFDPILANILERDPAGQVILLASTPRLWQQLIKQRFQNTLPPHLLERIRILPRPPTTDYLNLFTVVEVVLDTFPCGGSTSSYQALTVGTPVVTWPMDSILSRFTYACYQQMEMSECIANGAEEYVEIALRLATTPTYRQQVSQQILARKATLTQGPAMITELENFFTEMS